jgi:hypothetical protein
VSLPLCSSILWGQVDTPREKKLHLRDLPPHGDSRIAVFLLTDSWSWFRHGNGLFLGDDHTTTRIDPTSTPRSSAPLHVPDVNHHLDHHYQHDDSPITNNTAFESSDRLTRQAQVQPLPQTPVPYFPPPAASSSISEGSRIFGRQERGSGMNEGKGQIEPSIRSESSVNFAIYLPSRLPPSRAYTFRDLLLPDPRTIGLLPDFSCP